MGISVRYFTQRFQEICCRLKTNGERTGLLSTIVSFIHSMYTGILLLIGHVHLHTFIFF